LYEFWILNTFDSSSVLFNNVLWKSCHIFLNYAEQPYDHFILCKIWVYSVLRLVEIDVVISVLNGQRPIVVIVRNKECGHPWDHTATS
jgi:hypothetical protein